MLLFFVVVCITKMANPAIKQGNAITCVIPNGRMNRIAAAMNSFVDVFMLFILSERRYCENLI